MHDKRIKALEEKRNAIIEQMEAMTAAAIDDNGEERAFTDEEQAKFDELEKQAKALKATIEAEERARDASMKVAPASVSTQSEDRAQSEERAFANFLRGIEDRADNDVNMTTTAGQATIPTTIANKIITKVNDICPIYQLATKYNVGGTLTIPYYPATKSGATPDISMAYASEFTELESTSGSFDSITLQAFLAGVLTKVSKSLINNSQFDIVSFVVNQMAENISRWIERELLLGSTGYITGLSDVTQIVNNTTSVLTADNLIDLQDSVKDAFQANAVWIMSPKTRNAIRKLKDGQQNFLLERDFTAKWGYRLLGKDVFISDNMPDLGTGNRAIFYGDMSGLALKISEQINIEILREKYATEHAIGVVGYMECDSKVENQQKIACMVGKAA